MIIHNIHLMSIGYLNFGKIEFKLIRVIFKLIMAKSFKN